MSWRFLLSNMIWLFIHFWTSNGIHQVIWFVVGVKLWWNYIKLNKMKKQYESKIYLSKKWYNLIGFSCFNVETIDIYTFFLIAMKQSKHFGLSMQSKAKQICLFWKKKNGISTRFLSFSWKGKKKKIKYWVTHLYNSHIFLHFPFWHLLMRIWEKLNSWATNSSVNFNVNIIPRISASIRNVSRCSEWKKKYIFIASACEMYHDTSICIHWSHTNKKEKNVAKVTEKFFSFF